MTLIGLYTWQEDAKKQGRQNHRQGLKKEWPMRNGYFSWMKGMQGHLAHTFKGSGWSDLL
jgi:hypothetical protein